MRTNGLRVAIDEGHQCSCRPPRRSGRVYYGHEACALCSLLIVGRAEQLLRRKQAEQRRIDEWRRSLA